MHTDYRLGFAMETVPMELRFLYKVAMSSGGRLRFLSLVK